jgi:O-antigen/teichoic acid export membrane protein
MAELRLSNRVWSFSLIKLGNVAVNVALNFYLILGLGWGIEAILIANVIASGITLAAGYAFNWSQWSWSFSKESLQTALMFGLPYVPAGIGYLVNETIDRFFLTTMSAETVAFLYGEGISALEVTGVYSACYKLSIFMTMIVQMFNMTWQPFYVKNFKNEGYKAMSIRIFEYMNVAGMLIFLGVGLFAQEIVSIQIPGTRFYLIDDAYWWGLSIVPILLVANWFKLWYYIFISGLVIKEKTSKIPLVTALGAATTLILLILLIPRFGMMGAAYTTLVSFFMMAGFMYVFSQKEFRVDYPVFSSLFIILLVSTPVALGWLPYLNLEGVWSRILYSVIGMGLMLLFPLKRRYLSNLG